MKNFALTGVGGYIAPRHLQAIKETGNNLIAALDPSDSVGILDSFFDKVRFFTEFERFDRHCEKLRRKSEDERVHYVSICSPNFLHDAHIRFALRIGAHAICEKPLVLNPWNIEPLREMEKETGKKVNTILQLRLHPAFAALKKKLQEENSKNKHNICLTYVTSRGYWYNTSWKGNLERSGGLATNIGIHFFDLLIWLFGDVVHSEVHVADPLKTGGFLELEKANVKWFLSIDKSMLPSSAVNGKKTTFRSITLNSEEIEFSEEFNDLHTACYREILNGKGFGLEDSLPSITLAHKIRNAEPEGVTSESHSFLLRK
ncbi:MAG: Gfo/Idh/MocA family oxidoreductase [bacterium]